MCKNKWISYSDLVVTPKLSYYVYANNTKSEKSNLQNTSHQNISDEGYFNLYVQSKWS